MLNEHEVEQVIWNYNQLRNMVRLDHGEGKDLAQLLGQVDRLVHRELPELLKKVAPPNIYELTEDFHAEYEKFKDFIVYESLIGKNVVGLGGGFSSGKSSFLNTLMEAGEILPENINPSTSVPAYIVHGSENIVKAINIFDVCVRLELEAINEIAHGFGAVGEEEEGATESVQLGHILKNLFLETDLQIYENLAFLDTPGYSKPDSENYSAKTDEKIARQQLNTVDFILWFLPVSEAGSFTDSDIQFIKSLNQEIPITVICSKALRRTEEQRQEILAKVKEQVLAENLNVKDIFFFDREEPEGLDSGKIRDMFACWNQESYEEDTFARRFKRLFWECREYYKKKREEAGTEIRNLQNALLLLDASDEVALYIERVKSNSEREREEMTRAEKEMVRLQTEFFKEIKTAADEVGIYMPEPKDIDVLEDKITNPLTVLQNYNREHGEKTALEIGEMKERILDAFREMKPVFECEPGGSRYREKIVEILKEIPFPKADEIQFGRDVNYREMMDEMFAGIHVGNEKLIDNVR